MKERTKREYEAMMLISEANKKLSWFCVGDKIELKYVTLKKGWYKITKTKQFDNESWVHDVNLRDTKNHIRITDIELNKIISKFDELNKHLLYRL